jgi:hypothetical protein
MKSLKDLALDIDSSNSTDASGNALVSALEENYYLEGVDVIHNIDEKQELSNKIEYLLCFNQIKNLYEGQRTRIN